MVWGAAGTTGLAQTLGATLAANLAGQFDRPGEDVRQHICGLVQHVQNQANGQAVQPQAQQPPVIEGVFCWYDNAGEPRILVVPSGIAGHVFLDRFGAVGSGTAFANFAMASVTHLDTPNLDLEQAKMVVYRAIDDMIAIAAYGIGPPIHMYAITQAAGAVAVPDTEMPQIRDSVSAWKQVQRTSLGPLAGPDSEDEPGDDPGIEPPEP